MISNLFAGSEFIAAYLRNLQSSILISQGIKAIVEWLRLFDNTSFCVTLIFKALIDVVYFLLIILLLLVYVGNAM